MSDVDVNSIILSAIAESTGETAPTEVAPAETVPTEAAPAETVPAEVAPVETVPAVETLDERAAKLERYAIQRRQERQARTVAEQKAVEVAAENAALKTEVTALRAAQDEIAAFKRDPIAWLESHEQDPVAFLQKAHRIALNPNVERQKLRDEQRDAEIAELRKQRQSDPDAVASTVESVLQQREIAAAAHELVAESESGAYPLFALESPETRITLAKQVATKFVKAGRAQFTYADVCEAIESDFAAKFETRQKALATKSQKQTPQAQQSSSQTISQSQVTADTGATRIMTEAERNAAADALIEREVFARH